MLNNYLGISAWGWTRNFLIAVSRSLQGTEKKQGWAGLGATAVGALAEGCGERLPLACGMRWLSPPLPTLAVTPVGSRETEAIRDKFGPQNMRGSKSKGITIRLPCFPVLPGHREKEGLAQT